MEHKARRKSQREDNVAAARELSDELGRIVQSKGYRYAKGVSLEMLKPFECDPPKRGEDGTQWQTYNTIRWTFERFFATLETLAATKPELPKG